MTGVGLRPMRPDDIPDGLRLCRAAGWNQVEADWRLFLDMSPDSCRVAVTGSGEIVGTVTTLKYENRFSWVGMVLVDPAYRRSGIGRRLLEEALSILGHEPAIRLDATPAGQRIYAPLGFTEEYGLQRMQRPATLTLAAVDPTLRRITAADIGAIATYDRDVFGARRDRVLEMLYRTAPEYAWIAGRDRVDGYVFGRHGHDFEHIGPLVASSDRTARHLMTACLTTCSDRPFVIDVSLNERWVSWLESMQFSPQRPFVRMCRGKRPAAERRDRVFAITGPEFG